MVRSNPGWHYLHCNDKSYIGNIFLGEKMEPMYKQKMDEKTLHSKQPLGSLGSLGSLRHCTTRRLEHWGNWDKGTLRYCNTGTLSYSDNQDHWNTITSGHNEYKTTLLIGSE